MSRNPKKAAQTQRRHERAAESRRQRHKQTLFTAGADAFARSLPEYVHATFPDGAPPVYVCPLCLRAFPVEAIDAGTITIEHAPPQCLGGPALLLTCSECNNHAGVHLDHAMLKGDRPALILRGEYDGPHRIKFGINGSPKVNATIDVSAEGRRVIIPKQGPNDGGYRNGPADYLAFVAESERIRETNTIDQSEMQISFDEDRHHAHRSRVGWLRAAYLIAFSAFGYRYAFGPALDRVRDQITRCDAELIPSFAVVIPDSPRKTRRLMVQNDRGADLRSIVVQIGWHGIFLPHPHDTAFYDRFLRHRRAVGERAAWTGDTEYVWPRWPTYALDQQDRR